MLQLHEKHCSWIVRLKGKRPELTVGSGAIGFSGVSVSDVVCRRAAAADSQVDQHGILGEILDALFATFRVNVSTTGQGPV